VAEVTHIGFNRLETENGVEPSPQQEEDFRSGRRNLWLADYHFSIYRQLTEPVPLVEFERASIKHH